MQKILTLVVICFATLSIAQERQGNVGGKGGNGSIIDKILNPTYEFDVNHCQELKRIHGTRRQRNVCARLEDLIVRERATYDQQLFYDDCCIEN